ncbi:MAG: aminotransferase class V-fold PLP-dependent enzyme [Deltaproteobacteria bacterium]|nr:aminotransferase class V-fold PLP-dependent enzyme [Deltaproteobacteria bacterium]
MIYLNNAATGFPKPPLVLEAVRTSLDVPPYDARRSTSASAGEDPIESCRSSLADFFGVANAQRIAFAGNATDALNMAIHGLSLVGGAHVITTQADHNATLRPLATLQREGDIALTVVRCDRSGRVAPSDIEAALKPNTRAVILSHASNVTGVVQDLSSIGSVAHAHGALLVVDAAQSAGQVAIDVKEIGIDLLAFTGHKSLHALQGIGGLYVREGVDLRPWRIGGTGVRSHEPYQPEEMPLRLEAGTLNSLGIISLKAGIEFIRSIGLEAITQRKRAVVGAFLDAFEAMPEIVLYGEPDRDRAMIALNIEGIDPEQAGYILENAFSIVVRSGLHCAPLIHGAMGSSPSGCLRISPSYFTRDKEVEATIEALKQLCQMSASTSTSTSTSTSARTNARTNVGLENARTNADRSPSSTTIPQKARR